MIEMYHGLELMENKIQNDSRSLPNWDKISLINGWSETVTESTSLEYKQLSALATLNKTK